METVTPLPTNRKQKFAKWCKAHKEELITTTVVTGISAAYIGLIVAAVKADNAAATEYVNWINDVNGWITEMQNAGKAVYRLDDGRFLVMALDASREIVIK